MSGVPILNTPVTLSIAILYLLVCLGIGVWSYGRTKTAADYFITGQTIGLWVVSIAAFSAIMSGFGFVGGPGLTYQFGTSSLWITFAQAVAFPMAWFLLAKRMRLMAEVRNVLSLPDAVAARYRSNGARFWMAVALLFGILGYLGTQVQAMGVVMQTIFGIDLVTGALIGLAILTIYTMMGGILAGVYTDFFQGVIMIFASVAIFLWCMSVGGGMTNISHNVALADPKLIGPFGGMSIMTALTWYFLFAIGNAGQPHMATKLYMTKDIYRLKWGGFISAVAYALCALLWMSLGLTMRSLVQAGQHAPLKNPDLTAVTFLMEYTPEVLAGIVLAGLMAAIMSTGNSFLNLGAAAIVRDIPQAFGKKIENEVFWARIATLGLVVVSTFFALYMKTLVALLGVFGWGTFAAAVVPVVVIGLNWKRGTAAAAMAAIIVGLVANFTLEIMAKYNVYKLPNGAVVGAVATMLAIVVYLAVSIIQKKPGDESDLDPDIKEVLEA